MLECCSWKLMVFVCWTREFCNRIIKETSVQEKIAFDMLSWNWESDDFREQHDVHVTTRCDQYSEMWRDRIDSLAQHSKNMSMIRLSETTKNDLTVWQSISKREQQRIKQQNVQLVQLWFPNGLFRNGRGRYYEHGLQHLWSFEVEGGNKSDLFFCYVWTHICNHLIP